MHSRSTDSIGNAFPEHSSGRPGVRRKVVFNGGTKFRDSTEAAAAGLQAPQGPGAPQQHSMQDTSCLGRPPADVIGVSMSGGGGGGSVSMSAGVGGGQQQKKERGRSASRARGAAGNRAGSRGPSVVSVQGGGVGGRQLAGEQGVSGRQVRSRQQQGGQPARPSTAAPGKGMRAASKQAVVADAGSDEGGAGLLAR